MQALASFVMRGRGQAVMLTAAMAILSLLFPPVSIISTAAVALVTLRQGPSQGLLVLLLAALAAGVLSLLALGQVTPVAGFAFLMWLPVWVLAMVLRVSRSLSVTLQGALLLGLVVISAQFLQSQDPVSQWHELLEPFVQSLVDAQLVQQGQQQKLLQVMAEWMPGVVGAGFFLQSMVSLFLARWWQALLYNPGGFRSEFHQLRLPKLLAVGTLLVLLTRLLTGAQELLLLEYLVMLLLSAWFLQGLAMAHGALGLLKASNGWLIGIYMLLVFAMPHMATLLAAAGFADVWVDFRARLKRSDGKDEPG